MYEKYFGDYDIDVPHEQAGVRRFVGLRESPWYVLSRWFGGYVVHETRGVHWSWVPRIRFHWLNKNNDKLPIESSTTP